MTHLHLPFAQIETTTTCNQRCYFCPVSQRRRPKAVMSLELLRTILTGLQGCGTHTLYINGFNEPTYDSMLVEKVKMIKRYGMNISLNSNGSGLHPELTNQLCANGVQTFLFNVSTLDPQHYEHTRGNKDISKVRTHIDYLLHTYPQANVTIMVLGQLDTSHAENINAIMDYFSPQGAHILVCPMADFATTNLPIMPSKIYHQKLRGCVSRRDSDWLHFIPDGSAIMCCQDYDECYKVGNIHDNTVEEIYFSDSFTRLRHWINGTEQAPTDFICRTCVFALSDDMPYHEKARLLFCQRCTLPRVLGQQQSCAYCAVLPYLSTSLSE
jgi:MoaA/NifB/PqqE/SkfB family radical SAM enzyme